MKNLNLNKKLLALGVLSMIFISGCSNNLDFKDFSNFLPEIKTENKITKLDSSLEELIAEIEIEEPLEISYDRDLYTSSSQYYVGHKGEEYSSIRKYAFYESVWYDDINNVYTDPYTGEKLDLKNSDYDHIIPLHYANQHGADEWSTDKKKEYADNPIVGVDVNSHDNRSKGDKGPSEWMPKENKDDYAYTWLVIAAEYDLSITKEDMDVIKSTLDGIPKSELNIINEYK